ncbi:MAG TPA: purine-nucleoside phosphorylase [Gemmatimonadales bacterium]|nr:purine-nucleoside phosphorylase [Gemmatimonadales bacterium]
MSEAQRLDRSRAVIRQRLGDRRPVAAVVLGSGLGVLSSKVANAVHIPYQEIPGFPVPSVEGHSGELVAGTLAGREVLVQSGRFHVYEGHSAATAALPVRVFAALGIDTLLLTNAAGGIRRTFAPGTLMLIADQVNLSGRHPLAGPVLPGEDRFPDMSEPYDAELCAKARRVAKEKGIRLAEGVYAGLLGPSYETPAEIRMLERLGADAVGMSTVPEVIVARARGMRCLGISTITNAAAGISLTRLSHAEVMKAAELVKNDLAAILEGVIEGLGTKD